MDTALQTLSSRREARIEAEDIDEGGVPVMTAERLKGES
jgi:hypothetical protein